MNVIQSETRCQAYSISKKVNSGRNCPITQRQPGEKHIYYAKTEGTSPLYVRVGQSFQSGTTDPYPSAILQMIPLFL